MAHHLLFSEKLFSDTRLSQQPTAGVHLHITDWLAGVQRRSRQKKPLKIEINHFELIMQNEPNSPNARINITQVLTRDYENKRLHSREKTNPKRSQSKPI